MATEDDMARLKRLEEKVDGLGIQFEQLRADIKTVGEGVEDLKRQLSKDIKDMGRHWDTKWSPTISRSGTMRSGSGSWNDDGPANPVARRT